MSRSNRKVTKVRTCAAYSCVDPLPPGSRADRMYCSDRCAQRVTRARQRAAQRRADGLPPTRTDRLLAAAGLADDLTDGATTNLSDITTSTAEDKVTKARDDAPGPTGPDTSPIPETLGGEGFQRFARSDLPDNINDHVMTATEAANALGVSKPTISEWMALYNAARSADQAARNWQDDPAAQSQRDYALSSFRAFTETFFPDSLIPDFHEEWDEELTEALDEGERTMLLAPQRHGKTSFVLRQLLYRIAKNPNIRIIVVSKTADLASKTVAAARQYLENDPQFASVLLPPDTGFKPPSRRGLPWTNSEFTVATRTKIQKSSTMLAIGVGGSILNRDADLVVIDDPIDRSSMLSPTERANVREWFFTDFNSRIEEHTGVIYIGSRQHKEDLPGEIIRRNAEMKQSGLDPDWKVLLYRAHDPSCHVPLIDHSEDPEENDCILWPEFRTAQWLAQQQRANPDHFLRNYMNTPQANAFMPVKSDDIEWSYHYDEWLSTHPHSPLAPEHPDHPRTFGMPHSRTRLVASVDPAVAKKNAAVLWSYTTTAYGIPSDPSDPDSKRVPTVIRAIVDYAEPRPGSPGITDILDDWYDEYRVTDWVFETNYFADQIANDKAINDFKARKGLKFHTHYTTSGNKHDTHAGVLAMLSSFGQRPTPVLLPGGSTESRRAMERLVNQMLSYDPEGTHYSSGRKRHDMDDDLIMAMWFGWYWIERQTKNRSSGVKFDYGAGFDNFSPSHWSTPPWEGIA